MIKSTDYIVINNTHHYALSILEIRGGLLNLTYHRTFTCIQIRVSVSHYEVKQRVEEDGMRGAAIDPYLAKIPTDHAKYYPIYAKCVELNIPIVITTGPATLVRGACMEDASPAHIDRVTCDFPDLKIIISHGGYPYVNEAIMVVERNANVYMDLAEYEEQPFAEKYIEAANKFLSDKILFASAAPFMDFEEQIALYERLPFKSDVRKKNYV